MADCPRETFSPLEASRRAEQSETDIKAKVREFCSSVVTEEEFQQESLVQLVERRVCPAWYLASSPVLGRCLPLPQHQVSRAPLASQANLPHSRFYGRLLEEDVMI